MSTKLPKVCLAVCTNRGVKPKTVQSLLNLVAHGGAEFFVLVATEGYNISENRNYCVIQAKKNSCDYLLFIDDDMSFPPDTLEKLFAADKEIVGVNSYSRMLPLSTTVAVMDELGELVPHSSLPAWHKLPETLFKCFSVGAGVLLINMNVFEKIAQPWFAFTTMDVGKVLIGEDAWFCIQAKKAGYDIWCEPSIKIGHIGDYNYGM